MLLILLVQDQHSYDRFHADADRIYRVIAQASSSEGRSGHTYAATPAYLYLSWHQQPRDWHVQAGRYLGEAMHRGRDIPPFDLSNLLNAQT